MSSISVGDLKSILENYPDDYEVVMNIKHKYPISKEEGLRGWCAYINGVKVDDDFREIRLMNQVSGKDDIKMENRLLFEKDVIRAVDKHTNDENQLDNDISCILEEVIPVVLVGSKEAIDSLKVETKPVQKRKRVELFENEDVVLEQRGNRYYLSLYDKEGNFQREVTIDVKDDYKVGLGNCK